MNVIKFFFKHTTYRYSTCINTLHACEFGWCVKYVYDEKDTKQQAIGKRRLFPNFLYAPLRILLCVTYIKAIYLSVLIVLWKICTVSTVFTPPMHLKTLLTLLFFLSLFLFIRLFISFRSYFAVLSVNRSQFSHYHHCLWLRMLVPFIVTT